MGEVNKKTLAFNTKIDDIELDVDMANELKEELQQQGVKFYEVYHLVESFAHNLLENKQDIELRLENDDTNAFIDLDIKWESEQKALVNVLNVDLKKVDQEGLPVRPKGAMFDFGAIEAEAQALEAQAAQARAN